MPSARTHIGPPTRTLIRARRNRPSRVHARHAISRIVCTRARASRRECNDRGEITVIATCRSFAINSLARKSSRLPRRPLAKDARAQFFAQPSIVCLRGAGAAITKFDMCIYLSAYHHRVCRLCSSARFPRISHPPPTVSRERGFRPFFFIFRPSECFMIIPIVNRYVETISEANVM